MPSSIEGIIVFTLSCPSGAMSSSKHYIQANTNGILHDAQTASISPLNRGYLYGDSIYEVWRTYSGVIFAWEEHWARLQRSAQSLYFDLNPLPQTFILEQIQKTVAAYSTATKQTQDVYIRLQISRGCGLIGLDPQLADEVNYIILIQNNPQFPPEKYITGLHLSLAQNIRRNDTACLNPAWKTGNYLNNIMALREARTRAADEVVITNLKGEITEAAVCNIAFIENGCVVTPATTTGILEGITRKILIEKVAPGLGIPIFEKTITPNQLGSFQECFLLSTTKDITPVGKIDAITYPIHPASVTAKLKTAFTEYTQVYAQNHPELKVL